MLRAHKQAWCWQDEWYGLNMDDIRRLEKETQLALQLKFGNADNMDEISESETVVKVQEEISALVLRAATFASICML